MKTTQKNNSIQKKMITDSYFAKGHWGLKIRQTLIVLLAWLLVFLPFALILFPIIFRQNEVIVYSAFDSALRIFDFLKHYYLVAILLIIGLFILLTIWNNHQTKHQLQRKVMHDENQLVKRKQALDTFYSKRFGPEEFRKSVRTYTVSEEQNLDDDSIQKLYQENEVPLK